MRAGLLPSEHRIEMSFAPLQPSFGILLQVSSPRAHVWYVRRLTHTPAPRQTGPMRVLGTAIGGCVGALVMVCAHAASGGNDLAWQDRQRPEKIIVTTLLLATFCAILQLLRARDPPCEPAPQLPKKPQTSV